MITKSDLQKIYQWGLKSRFPLKLAPTTKGYTNKDIFICGLKFVRKNVNIRKNLMDQEIYDILKKHKAFRTSHTENVEFFRFLLLNHILHQGK